MADVYEVVGRLLSWRGQFGIMQEGTIINYGPACVKGDVLFSSWAPALPDEVKNYLKLRGLWHLIHVTGTYLVAIDMTRANDSSNYVLRVFPTQFTPLVKNDDEFREVEERLEEAGIGRRFVNLRGVYSIPYMTRIVQRELSKFLRGAGVRLKEYTPPWFEPGAMINAKPSTKRMTEEMGRFLGF